MKRIPDIIIRAATDSFTQIPNRILRGSGLSIGARGLLSTLLSNKEGWCSYISAIQKETGDKERTIKAALKELCKKAYLTRLRYRNKNTKKLCGMVWAYTDCPGKLNRETINRALNNTDMEFVETHNVETHNVETHNVETHNVETHNVETHTCGNRPPNNTNLNKIKSNKINLNKIKSSSSRMREEEEEEEAPNQTNTNQDQTSIDPEKNIDPENNQVDIDPEKEQTRIDPEKDHIQKKITPGMFEAFWKIYPRKVDKGKAKKTWERICTREKEKPSWDQIEEAIHAQIKSERWQEKEYIPHPTTWLNQTRWIDDPEEMICRFKKKEGSRSNFESEVLTPSPRFLIASHFTSQTTRKHFHKDCFDPAQELFTSDPPQKLVKPLLDLYDQINELQKKLWPSHTYHNSAPSPISLIQGYITDLESWVTSPSLGMLNVDHRCFKDFCRKWGRSHDEYERDPITGRSYVNH